MTFRPSERVHDSRNQLLLTLETPNDSKKTRIVQHHLSGIVLYEIKHLVNHNSKTWKSRMPTNPDDPYNIFENLEYEINSHQTHELAKG